MIATVYSTPKSMHIKSITKALWNGYTYTISTVEQWAGLGSDISQLCQTPNISVPHLIRVALKRDSVACSEITCNTVAASTSYVKFYLDGQDRSVVRPTRVLKEGHVLSSHVTEGNHLISPCLSFLICKMESCVTGLLQSVSWFVRD